MVSTWGYSVLRARKVSPELIRTERDALSRSYVLHTDWIRTLEMCYSDVVFAVNPKCFKIDIILIPLSLVDQ